MRAVIQRVTQAKVMVNEESVGAIKHGYVVLVAFAPEDGTSEMLYIAEKIVNLRLFDDEQGQMNLSLQDVSGGLLVVSQFTLYGDTRKGRRPSYSKAAPAEQALNLFEQFVALLKQKDISVECGRFQAYMQVELTNDGPVTVIIDSI